MKMLLICEITRFSFERNHCGNVCVKMSIASEKFSGIKLSFVRRLKGFLRCPEAEA